MILRQLILPMQSCSRSYSFSSIKITRGSRSVKGFKGLAFGYKGYLGKKIFEELMQASLSLITRKLKNMKEKQELSNQAKKFT